MSYDFELKMMSFTYINLTDSR